jgi:N-acetylglutamate synthase-like GNAT family acetyltransferase
MKLLLSPDEVKLAVAEYLKKRGFPNADAANLTVELREQGQYDDRSFSFEGVSLEIKEDTNL